MTDRPETGHAPVHAARYFDGAQVRVGTVVAGADGIRLLPTRAPDGSPHLDGLVTGLFTDHHVHLQLVDHTLLAGSRLGAVADLGAELGWISDLAAGAAVQNSGKNPATHPTTPETAPEPAVSPESWTQISYAGPFLTAVGGYPSDRDWAPAGAVRQLADPDDAARAVDDLTASGVSFLKVVGNSDAGPVLDDELMRALARLAAEHRVPLVAHAEGPGQAQRVARLGATRLAHAPFSEHLTDDEIAEQAATVSWISTMAIHEGEALEVVTDNVRRFFAAGGELVYGSDMGNGPTPVDLRGAEIDALRTAGIDGLDLLTALAPADPLLSAAPLLLLPDDDPNRSRLLTTADLEY
ncbi:hydrolase [Microbacterium sp. Mu-80]|uniref:Hydrolase n=1 Tax=Microbacterium bandirmense TaxID=3122050 RepID=A0ABU8LBH1_9MICO